jgi:hypothetical protein
MTIAELKEKLDEYGDHLEVVLEGPSDYYVIDLGTEFHRRRRDAHVRTHQGTKEGKLMSIAAVERKIIEELREVIGNPKLRNKDLLEWSTGPITPQDGETVVRLPGLLVYCAFPTSADKRDPSLLTDEAPSKLANDEPATPTPTGTPYDAEMSVSVSLGMYFGDKPTSSSEQRDGYLRYASDLGTTAPATDYRAAVEALVRAASAIDHYWGEGGQQLSPDAYLTTGEDTVQTVLNDSLAALRALHA